MSEPFDPLTQVRREAEVAGLTAWQFHVDTYGNAADTMLDGLAKWRDAERAVWERELGEALKREAALRGLLEHLDKCRQALKGRGCSNGDCVLDPPPQGAMHTNSSCKCLANANWRGPYPRGPVERMLRDLHHIARVLRGEPGAAPVGDANA